MPYRTQHIYRCQCIDCVRVGARGVLGVTGRGRAWDDGADDFWLQQARATLLEESTAALVHQVPAECCGAVQRLIVGSVLVCRPNGWAPALRHIIETRPSTGMP